MSPKKRTSHIMPQSQGDEVDEVARMQCQVIDPSSMMLMAVHIAKSSQLMGNYLLRCLQVTHTFALIYFVGQRLSALKNCGQEPQKASRNWL